MKKIHDYFFPAYYHQADTDLKRRIRLGISIAIAFIPLILLYLPLFIFVLNNPIATTVLIFCIIFSLLGLFLLKKNIISFTFFSHYYISLGLIVHTVNVTTTGGTGSAMITGYLVMPLVAALLQNRFATIIWSIIGYAGIVILGVVEKVG